MTCEMNAPDFIKKVFNTLSSFVVLLTHLEEKQQLNDKSFQEEKKITVGKTLINQCVPQMCLKSLLIDYH